MGNSIKKVISYLLIVIILVFTVIALLGIWDIIVLEDIIRKMILSLLVIFAASAVILFIFSVMIKDSDSMPEKQE